MSTTKARLETLSKTLRAGLKRTASSDKPVITVMSYTDLVCECTRMWRARCLRAASKTQPCITFLSFQGVLVRSDPEHLTHTTDFAARLYKQAAAWACGVEDDSCETLSYMDNMCDPQSSDGEPVVFRPDSTFAAGKFICGNVVVKLKATTHSFFGVLQNLSDDTTIGEMAKIAAVCAVGILACIRRSTNIVVCGSEGSRARIETCLRDTPAFADWVSVQTCV